MSKTNETHNIDGNIKKHIHEKMIKNYDKTIETLNYKIDDLKDKNNNISINHEEFKKSYKSKCNEFDKLTLKYEKCNTKGLIDELEALKKRCRAYFDKYGNIE
tara:strand:- start:458 stop:766 length:309 start_codon:yes stop_codon:yes gene_type:complete